MKQLFLQFAPYVTLLFIVALPPDVIRNFRRQTYASGPLFSWGLRIVGYIVFGIYLMMKSEYVAGTIQFVALALSLLIVGQSFLYRRAA